MRVLLDACVLFPTILRETLIGAAARGGFAPLWSARILEEWARATRRLPEGAEPAARAAIARLRADWPDAEVPPDPDLEATLSLPDPDDLHVLAAAIAGRAEALLTLNRADFPGRTLARHGLILRAPDEFLCALSAEGHDLHAVATEVRRRAGGASSLRNLLKRAGLPRLGKTLDGADSASAKSVGKPPEG